MPQRHKAYTEAGVDLDAANTLVDRLKSLVQSTHTKGVLSEIGGFGGLFKPDLNNMQEPVLVASTDGVGTKIKLAAAFGRHDHIGVDLVAMSVNDILVQGAKPLFFLDYLATGKLDVATAEAIVAGVAEGCRRASVALLGGETAEMPDMYAPGEYDLAGFCLGLVDNASIVDGSGIRVGDAVIGLASTGPHSNGYSLIRKVLGQSGLGPDDRLPVDGDEAPTVADALLAPTAIYTSQVRNLMRDFRIKGMVHITGGGFYDNIPRILPGGVEARLQFGAWDIPPVFHWLREQAGLDWPEMLQIFNCGVGYVFIVDHTDAGDVLDRLTVNLKEQAWQIGAVARRPDRTSEQVVIEFPAAECESEQTG